MLVLVDLPKKNEGDHKRYSDSPSIYPQTKVEREREVRLVVTLVQCDQTGSVTHTLLLLLTISLLIPMSVVRERVPCCIFVPVHR